MSTINLGSEKTITVSPAVTKNLSSVTLDRTVDNPVKKRVLAFVLEIPHPIILWEGSAYDAVGDWTQAQADAQIIKILTA